MAASISVGTTFALVAGVPATFDASGYAAVTYTAVGEVNSLGDFGGTGEVIENTPLATGVIEKFIGSINYGTINAIFSKDLDSTGQGVIQAGFDGGSARAEHSVRITFPSGDIAYLGVKIASFVTSVGDANTVTGGNTDLELVRKPVIVTV